MAQINPMVAGAEVSAGDAAGGGCGGVQGGRVEEGRRGVGRSRCRTAFDRLSVPQAAWKLWEAAGSASPPPLTSWSKGRRLAEQWGASEPRHSRTRFRLYGAF